MIPLIGSLPSKPLVVFLIFAAAVLPIARVADPPVVFIAADKRHQGVSRFDLFPFTDRPKGDPDRYRAVNPRFVVKEKGRYYFAVDARPGAHLFDEALQDKGELPQKSIAVDFGVTREAKDANGKTLRYVGVKDGGFVLRNSLPPADEIRSGKWFSFPLRPGIAHTLHDGTGIVRGTVAARDVRLNYGQQKIINGERCLYAFSTVAIPAGQTEKRGASGWIKASALEEGNDPQYSAEVVTKMQPPTIPATGSGAFTPYTVTGGDPQEKTGRSDASGKPIYRYGYTDDANTFVAYKVLPGVARAGRASVASTDYLKRSDGVINLGFNVAGVSNDTYRVDGPNRPLTFYRASDRDATVEIDLYFPRDATHRGTEPVAKMVFVYGYVDEGSAKRWGWIPLGALQAKPPPPNNGGVIAPLTPNNGGVVTALGRSRGS